MKTIIAGGRRYGFTMQDVTLLRSMRGEITEVVSGGAPGADSQGEKWAEANHIPVTVFPAQWDLHGRAAGPIRNREMAEYPMP